MLAPDLNSITRHRNVVGVLTCTSVTAIVAIVAITALSTWPFAAAEAIAVA